ncbi:FUSC family protein [Streptomyces sp. NPDC002788]
MTRVTSAVRRTAGAIRLRRDSGTAAGTARASGARTEGAATKRGRTSDLEQGGRAVRPVDAVRRETRSAWDAVRAAWRGPGRERDLVVQSLKAALAAVIAWLIGGVWMGDPLALMAPWVALVLVQATVYSSLVQGARQFGAICVGALLASAAQAITGDTTGALALSVPVLMLLANWPRFGDQGIYAATTALFTVTAGTVSLSGVGHRVGLAALGAVIGVAVNALILPPIHLRDVRENLAALAREAGDVLHTVAADLREGEWDAETAAGWVGASAGLDHRLDALQSARRWSQESLRLTYGPLRALHRVPNGAALPPVAQDERFARVTGHVMALTRALAVSVDDNRTPAPPEGPALRAYARLLELIGEACHAQADSLREGGPDGRPGGETETAMRDLHEELQDRLCRHAEEGAANTAVLGTLLLQAENLWAETVPDDRPR